MFRSRVLLTAAVAATLAIVSAAAVPQTSKPPCCFKNPGYAGTCKVQPADDETCASILAYLNNPMAEGKSYCGGTTIRGGWTQTSCDEKELGTPENRH